MVLEKERHREGERRRKGGGERGKKERGMGIGEREQSFELAS